MGWDPLRLLPRRERCLVWASVAFWCCLLRGPLFLESIQAPSDWVPDFFQEYASARNHFEGLPVYASHWRTMERYLGWAPEPSATVVNVNAHPPTSVLLAFPFARLNFPTSFLIWNLLSLCALGISLWLVVKELAVPFRGGAFFPLATFLLLCNPLVEQIRHGQLNLVLLLLITGLWAADRSDRRLLAGVLLGTAAVIKLFPAFLLLYYVLRGRWRVVCSALLTVTAVTVLTAAVLGVEAYRAYFLEVVPVIQAFRVGWDNASMTGYWTRLFDPSPGRAVNLWKTSPLWENPRLAWSAALISELGVTAVLACVIRRSRTRADDDLGFALAVTAMLLVTPIVWEHYFLLLLVPLAVTWNRLPTRWEVKSLFATILVCFWLSPTWIWVVMRLGHRPAGPLDTLGLLSYQFYALLALFGLIIQIARHDNRLAVKVGSS